MSENKLKHLEFIQNIITRKNSNSFTIKGWSVTLVAAVFALAAKDSDKGLIVVAFIPVLMFALLDGVFLSYERRFRDLYKNVAKKKEEDIDFDITLPEVTWRSCWASATLFSANVLFHGVLALLVSLFSWLYWK